MHRLSSIVFLFFIGFFLHTQAQSPHGDSFKIDCANCHNPTGWSVDVDVMRFDHDTTSFALEGVHRTVDCKDCHFDLIFDDTPSQCMDCHSDIHSMSVGTDCVRCHNSENWLVDNIPELHEANGFVLAGVHNNLSCMDCHFSETDLRFDRIGNDCVNCHLEDFNNTMEPNHIEIGFTTQCADCHDIFIPGWISEFTNHDFFPLTGGHDIQDCAACHDVTNYSDISAECIACHQEDYLNTVNPNHQLMGFSTDCASCHTTDPNWMPAVFDHDDQYFPIYSGKHRGEWNDCIDCHINPNDYSVFSCIECHEHSRNKMDGEHGDVNGYIYESNACFNCHPDGQSD